MPNLGTCSSCGGFVPHAANECPHCLCGLEPSKANRRLRRAVVGVLGIVGGGAFAMTLMACYGGPVRPAPTPGPEPTTSSSGSPAPSMSTIDPPTEK